MTPIQVEPWESNTSPSQQEIEERLRAEGLSPSRWSNGPGDRYGAHSHSYHKVLYCVSGSITFDIEGEDVSISAGDRLEIPRGTTHSAVVGPEGVSCMEATR